MHRAHAPSSRGQRGAQAIGAIAARPLGANRVAADNASKLTESLRSANQCGMGLVVLGRTASLLNSGARPTP